jgi:hypothetical protein
MDFSQAPTKIEISAPVEPSKVADVKKSLEEIIYLVSPEELAILVKGLSNPSLKKLAIEYLK